MEKPRDRWGLHFCILVVTLIDASSTNAQGPLSCETWGSVTDCYFAPQRELWATIHNPDPNAGLFDSKEEACVSEQTRLGQDPASMRLRRIGGNYYICDQPAGNWQVLLRGGVTCPIFPDEINSETGRVQMDGPRFRTPGNSNGWPSPSVWPTRLWEADTSEPMSTVMCVVRHRPVPERHAGPPDVCVGNPLDPVTARKYQAEVDIPTGASHFSFRRSYQSGNVGGLFTKHFGQAWQHNFGSRLQVATNVVNALRPDGRIVHFVQSGGTWGTWSDEKATLVELTSGGIRSGWRLSLTSNEIDTYDAGGRLVLSQQVNGRRYSFTYTDGSISSPNGAVVRDAAGAPLVPPQPVRSGTLLRVTDDFGRALEFGYDIAGRTVRLDAGNGFEIRYLYDTQNRLSEVVFPDTTAIESDNPRRRYLYEHPNFASHLTGIVDEKGVRYATFDYEPSGAAFGTRYLLAQSSVMNYTLNHSPWRWESTATQTVITPLGSQVSKQFRNILGKARLISSSQPAGSGCGPSSSALTYDVQANVTSRTDFNNNKICYANDLLRNLEVKRIEGVTGSVDCAAVLSSPPTGARVISTEWHPDWRLETKIAEPKKLTTITYNGQGATCAPSTVLVDGKPPAVMCSRTEQATTDESGASGFAATTTGNARTWRYTYTTYGRVLTATDPNNRTTTTSYHPDNDADLGKRGNVASISNAANHITYITDYNPHGQPTRIVDPNGVVTVLTYDPRMRLTNRTVGNEATVFGYDPVGQMTSVNLPDGARLTYSYDAAHRLTAINDHKGNRIDYTLDAMGNRTAEQMKDPGGVLVGNIARVIDALSRVQQVTGSVQ